MQFSYVLPCVGMEHLFFKLEKNLEEVKTIFFTALGIKEILEGDSSHYIEGVYYFHSVFGVRITLAYNNYDYDDVYNYFVSIDNDVLSEVQENENVVTLIKDILLLLLPKVLKTDIAYENNDNSLVVFEH